MKPHAILSCFFAAYGVYLTASATFAAVAAFGGLLMASQFPRGDGFGWVIAQYPLSFVPLIIGIVLVLFARRFGALSAKYAGLADDPEWEIHITPQELLSVLLATIGVYLAATEGAAILRLAYLLFEVKAGGRAISEAASHNLPDGTQIITHAVCAAAGAMLAKKCRTVARALIHEKNA